MKVLHLASWYPNKTGTQDGDFIQRHLKAIAVLMPVHLIFVVKDENIGQRILKTSSRSGNLTETIIYYKPLKTGLRAIDKLISFRTYLKVFKDELQAYISHDGSPDLVHVHVAMKAGIPALWLKRKFRIPFVLSEHWSGYYRSDPDNYFTRDKLFRYYTSNVIRKASGVTAVSADLASVLETLFGVKHPAVIFNVVNTDLFRFSPVARHGFRFLHVSNMHPIKNIRGILAGLARLKKVRSDWQLVMIGSIEPGYQALAESLGISEHIDWKGLLDHTEMPEKIRSADCLVMFSHHENLSCVVCESLCCGVPVIATKVGGLPEIINETNGRLCDPGDETSLFNELMHFMDHRDGYDRNKIAADASAKFNETLIASQFIALYNELEGAGNKPS